MRVGQGYDAHRFVEGRRLVLGGVELDHELGLAAHSDGDVVLHALCDALLGAAALGDIGQHFPDKSDEFKDIDSRILLRRVMELIDEKGYVVENTDITIVAQAPKMAPHIQLMRERIADDLRITLEQVSVKATTTEGMGFAGRGEGIATYAVVLINRVK